MLLINENDIFYSQVEYLLKIEALPIVHIFKI